MSERGKRIKRILKASAGTTMVEMVVSFLLLAIFLTTVTMVISNALTTYYREQRLMSIYSVADTVLKEARDDIGRMQGSGTLANGRTRKGYVKVRNASGTVKDKTDVQMHGTTVSAYEGVTIEFLQANDTDGQIMEQIDSRGSLNATMIDENGILKTKAEVTAAIPENQLTARYYLLAAKEQKDTCKGLFMDCIRSDSSVKDTYHGITGADLSVLWDVENRLPNALYQEFPVSVSFAVETHTDGADEVADQVTVFVKVYDKPKEGQAGLGDPVYQKEGIISLQNRVFYKKANTTYSD